MSLIVVILDLILMIGVFVVCKMLNLGLLFRIIECNILNLYSIFMVFSNMVIFVLELDLMCNGVW